MKKITFKTIKLTLNFVLLFTLCATIQAQNFTTGSNVGNTGEWFYNQMAKDLNGDGYDDIISIDNGSNLVTYLNNGSGGFGAKNTLDGGRWIFNADDLDGDGDIDIVASSNQSNTPGFYIYKNNGNGSFTLQSSTPINITLSGYTVLSQVQDLVIFDANGDGKKDIVLIPYISTNGFQYNDNTKQFLFLNTTANSTISFSQNAIINTNNHCSHGFAGDIDNDGDQDLVLDAGSSNGTEVYKNNGSGTFVFSGNAAGYSGNQFFYDWNKDGFLDIITMDDYNGYGLRWKQNDGSGNFAAGVQLLSTSIYGITYGKGFFADMNGDGLVDVVYGANDVNGDRGYVQVFYNTGCGFPSTPSIYSTQQSNSTSIGILKMNANNDGKADIFISTRGEVSKTIINNIATATPPILSTITGVTNASRCGDGNVTLYATASNGGTMKWWDAVSGGNLVNTANLLGVYVYSSNPIQNYYVDATLNGCTSSRVKVVATFKGNTTSSNTNATILATQLPYNWNGTAYTTAGTYSKTLTGVNSSGCDSVVTLNLSILNSLPAISGANTVCVGSSTTYTNSFAGGMWSIFGRATINASGVVIGTSAGVATVKYTVGTLSVSKSITVNAIPAIPSIAYLAGTTGVTGTGGVCKNRTFTLTGTPTGGTWSSTGVISITASGIVTTTNTLGACSVTYAYSSNGCSSSRTITNNIINCGSRGVNGVNVNNDKLSIYPNPAHSVITINGVNETGTAAVIDLYGKILKTQILNVGANRIDVSSLAKGMYLLDITTEKGKQTHKVVVE